MTCDACSKAQESPRTGRFNAGCAECEARAIARDYGGGEPEPLQAAMRKIWPDQERYRTGRVAVWNWVKRIHRAG